MAFALTARTCGQAEELIKHAWHCTTSFDDGASGRMSMRHAFTYICVSRGLAGLWSACNRQDVTLLSLRFIDSYRYS